MPMRNTATSSEFVAPGTQLGQGLYDGELDASSLGDAAEMVSPGTETTAPKRRVDQLDWLDSDTPSPFGGSIPGTYPRKRAR